MDANLGALKRSTVKHDRRIVMPLAKKESRAARSEKIKKQLSKRSKTVISE